MISNDLFLVVTALEGYLSFFLPGVPDPRVDRFLRTTTFDFRRFWCRLPMIDITDVLVGAIWGGGGGSCKNFIRGNPYGVVADPLADTFLLPITLIQYSPLPPSLAAWFHWPEGILPTKIYWGLTYRVIASPWYDICLHIFHGVIL